MGSGGAAVDAIRDLIRRERRAQRRRRLIEALVDDG